VKGRKKKKNPNAEKNSVWNPFLTEQSSDESSSAETDGAADKGACASGLDGWS
jgi:hypothetical protein